MTFTIVFEIDPTDGEVSAWSDINGGLLTTIADGVDSAVMNIRLLIEDFRQNEWKNEPFWQDVDVSVLQFEYQYSLVGFFDAYKALKITEIAKLAGLNPALVRAYANGDKNPSATQGKKIEEATHRLAESLLRARVMPQSA